ncbi:MAG: argininosuccinate lyase [Phototrophicales bacterium]|nr:MAG: argininosuccinate lyase [Phototrophicales bacterium]
MTLWGGRFTEPADDILRKLNDSISFDKRMYKEDIAGSIAYTKALADANVITRDEAQIIIEGLLAVKEEFDAGTFEIKPGDEDIHTAVERRLTEIVGPIGGKLHTGRSRNDQVATDFRLWIMNAIDESDVLLRDLQSVIIERAEEHIETIMPGYTHLQPAQPITFAHWLMSFFWMIARDRERFGDTRRRTAISPLGSGALAGNPFGIDRAKLAIELGMISHSQNSIDAVSDRDFVAETLFNFALLGTHLSRLAEDIILYSNPTFGFITISERYSTGSSLMPQKRNPDPMELTRGKSGKLIGNLTGFLSTLKGLPSTYNKDLQEDKETTFNTVDTMTILIPVITATIKTMKIHPDKMKNALNEEMLATDLADYLVKKGTPFRQAHHIIGQIIQSATKQNKPLSKLPLSTLQKYSTLFNEETTEALDFKQAIEKRHSTGGTAPSAVQQQIEQAKKLLTKPTNKPTL